MNRCKKPWLLVLYSFVTFLISYLIILPYFILVFGEVMWVFLYLLMIPLLVTGLVAILKSDYLATMPIQQQIDVFRWKKDYHRWAMTTIELGIWYTNKGEENKAIACYEKALSLVDSTEDSEVKSIAKHFLGCIYLIRNTFPIAEKYLQSSLEFSEKLQNRDMIIGGMEKLVELYHKTGNISMEHKYRSKLQSIKQTVP